jgi:hypothetical protein
MSSLNPEVRRETSRRSLAKFKADRPEEYAAFRAAERVKAKARRAANPEKYREYNRRWHKNTSAKMPERAKMWARKTKGQPEPPRPPGANCECCGVAFVTLLPCLDHCHETGVFRGWICRKCNSGIGLLGDTLEAARKAVAYLEKAHGAIV